MSINVKDFAVKVLKIDEDDQLSFAVKIAVENLSDDELVYFTLQGIDDEGFEVYSLTLTGNVPIGETKILTTREDYVDASEYRQIVAWQSA